MWRYNRDDAHSLYALEGFVYGVALGVLIGLAYGWAFFGR